MLIPKKSLSRKQIENRMVYSKGVYFALGNEIEYGKIISYTIYPNKEIVVALKLFPFLSRNTVLHVSLEKVSDKKEFEVK